MTGLNNQQVEESRRLHGSNKLTPPERTPLWRLFMEKFNDPIIQILLVAWVLSIVISCIHCWVQGEGYAVFLEPLGIFIAVILATGIGFWFEVKASKDFDILNQANDETPVTVIRNNKVCQVPRQDIVVGDIVLLNTGDEIPADGTLLEATNLNVNESTLTGELMVTKSADESQLDPEATYPTNRVLRSTTIMNGHATMQVDAVGDHTEYGNVYTGSQIDNGVETPLQTNLNKLAKQISFAGYSAAALCFLILTAKLLWTTFFSGDAASVADTSISHSPSGDGGAMWDFIGHILNYFMAAVTLIVMAVPEGLPMSVTLSLALSMRRMLRSNNLVRKMHACETMGAATVICTDKTGTLTQNRMTVMEMRLPGHVHKAQDFVPSANPTVPDASSSDPTSLSLLYENIAINSTAHLEGDQAIGNPTEGALLVWMHQRGIDYLTMRHNCPVSVQEPFDTERKYMTTTIVSPTLGETVKYIKGAPEVVLSMCQEDVPEDIDAQLLAYQSQAMRTLAFAYTTNDEITHFQAITAISDPIRPDVPGAIEACHKAGIDVKIVTGDTKGTACEIARQLGMDINEEATHDNVGNDQSKASNSSSRVITGTDFAALTDEEASRRVAQLQVICRARPADKQRLVHLLQEQGEIVAVTGDGTNDAPALNAAHVGLSMGDGTEVAKEASDITIMDNSFTSITKAVMWGRSLYQNIQRFLLFQLTINVAACLVEMVGSIMGTESPLTITQMLWVNLIMDTFAAGALASLPPNPRVMNDSPRSTSESIITRHMANWIFLTGGAFFVALIALLSFYYYFTVEDGSITFNPDHIHILSDHEQSLFFTAFVLMQWWNLFNARAFQTGKMGFEGLRQCPAFLGVSAAILIGQILIVEFGGTMFNVEPLSLQEWLNLLLLTSPVFLIGIIYRYFKYRTR